MKQTSRRVVKKRPTPSSASFLDVWKRRIADNYTRFKYLLLLYVSVLIVMWIAMFNIEAAIELGDGWFGEGFTISFFASLSEDMIFFGIIGLVGLVLSTRMPSDEEFNVRVTSLANNPITGKQATDFLRYKVGDMLNYSPSFKAVMTIIDYDASKDQIKVHVDYVVRIRNMCKDVAVPKRPVMGKIEADTMHNGDYGYISRHQLIDLRNDNNSITFIDTIPSPLQKRTTELDLEYTVGPASDVEWCLSYAVWWDLKKPMNIRENRFLHKVYRFTEEFEIEIDQRNMKDIWEFEIHYPTRGEWASRPTTSTAPYLLTSTQSKGEKQVFNDLLEGDTIEVAFVKHSSTPQPIGTNQQVVPTTGNPGSLG